MRFGWFRQCGIQGILLWLLTWPSDLCNTPVYKVPAHPEMKGLLHGREDDLSILRELRDSARGLSVQFKEIVV